jgi:hypothetical protein
MVDRAKADDLRSVRHLLVLGFASLAAFAAPVFAAHTPRPAGAVVGRVSGFRVDDVSFSLDADRPDRVSRVSFALVPPTAKTVRVSLGRSRASCRVRDGRAACVFAGAGPRLKDVGSLSILAAS